MTFDEFKKVRRKADELKKEIPTVYDELLSHYERYIMLREKNRCKIRLLYYELENVKGIDYGKQRNTYNHDAHIEKYYSVSDQITELEKENMYLTDCIKGLEYIKDNVKNATLKANLTACYFAIFDELSL